MAKFRFYQDKEVITWVRDYFEVEADTLDEAIAYVKNREASLEELECDEEKRAEFVKRDWDRAYDVLADNCDCSSKKYVICSCDLEDDRAEDSEVLSIGY